MTALAGTLSDLARQARSLEIQLDILRALYPPTPLIVYDAMAEEDIGQPQRVYPFPGTHLGVKVLHGQWMNSDPYPSATPWTEAAIAAAAEACAGHSIVVWDSEAFPLLDYQPWHMAVLDALRARLPAGTRLGLWASFPMQYYPALVNSLEPDEVFYASSYYKKWVAKDDQFIDNGIHAHIDFMAPHLYANVDQVLNDMALWKASARRLLDEAQRITEKTGLPTLPFIDPLILRSPEKLTYDQFMVQLQYLYYRPEIEEVILYGHYYDGSGERFDALRDFLDSQALLTA